VGSWTKVGSGFYQIVNSKHKFDDAENDCESKHGQLPVIYNQVSKI